MTHEIFNFLSPLSIYIYLFLNKYIALEVRFIGVGHLIVLLLVYTIELSMRLTSLSKILEGILICPHARVSACSSQALTACSHMYHANQWRSRTIDTPRIRGARGHRIPEYHWAPWQHDELRRDYNRLYRFPFLQEEWFLLLWGSKSTVISGTDMYQEAIASDWYEPSGLHQLRLTCRREPEA